MRLASLLLSALTLLVMVTTMFGLSLGLAFVKREAAGLPDTLAIRAYRPAVTTRLFTDDGTAMGAFAEENRTLVPLEAIPDRVIQAFVAAEDRHFWTHKGVDPVAIARAAVTNLRNLGTGRRVIGASTITQQLVKNLLVGDETSLKRKVREALLSLRIEREVGKQRVLELYLNDLYLGEGAYGVAAAAETYFDKPLEQLDLAEAAYLAGLPKGPANYHPIRRAEAALNRRAYVLDRMLEDGVISAEDVMVAKAAPLPRPEARNLGGAADSYFAEAVRREIMDRYGSDALYRGGLTVRTSLDPALQAEATHALRDGLVAYDRRHGWRGPQGRLPHIDPRDAATWAPAIAAFDVPLGAGDWTIAVVLSAGADARIGFPDGTTARLPAEGVRWARRHTGRGLSRTPRGAADVLVPGDVILVGAAADGSPLELQQIPQIEGALVALEVRSGRVLAMVGGFDHERSSFNRVTQALRQPGSAFKPFVYLAALEHGYAPASPVLDAPIAIDRGPRLSRWRPQNYSGGAGGLMTLGQALEKSKNLATVRLLYEIGLDPVGDVSRRFGLYEKLPNYPAALGALETTVLKLTAAYAMLANGGHRIQPTLIDTIEAQDGRQLFQAPVPVLDETTRIADRHVVAQLRSILEGVVQRGTAARPLGTIPLPIAGKTGTTNDNLDAWFVGFSPDLAVGVFVGHDQPRNIGDRETGGLAAAPIFGSFITAAHAIRPLTSTRFDDLDQD